MKTSNPVTDTENFIGGPKSIFKKPGYFYIPVFLGLLVVLFLFFRHSLNSARSAQKVSIAENAVAYSALMDERISVDLYNYIDMNLNPALETSALNAFFHNDVPGVSVTYPQVRENAAECVEMAKNLDGLILYRTSDNILLSTLSDYHYLAKINPAYPYLMNAIAQVNGDEPSFVYSSDGSVLYYFPVSSTRKGAGDSGSVNDCIIAILHKSEDFLGVDISPSSSLATFAVMKDGQVLSTEGYNALSQKLVSSIAGLAQSASSVYTYTDPNLPDYYFYIITSQVSELDYCYYEPALTGWPLLLSAFPISRFIALIILLTAAIIFGVLSVLFLLKARQSEKGPAAPALREADSGETDLMKSSFGSFPHYSGIIIECYCQNGEFKDSDIPDMFDQLIRDNLSFNKIAWQFSRQHDPNCLQYHLNYVNYNMRVLCDSLKMNLYNAVPEHPFNIYYSLEVNSFQEMERDLLYLHQHLHYSLVLGYKVRLSIQQIQTFEKNTEVLDINITGTIQNFLRTGAYDDFYAYLNHYKDITTVYPHPYSFMTWYSFSERYRFLEEAFAAVKQFFLENSFTHPVLQTTCNSVLKANPGFSNLCEYLISCVKDYQKENQHVLSDRSEQIMNTVYKFIEEDLAGANLSSIARKMQMTDSHLSRVFKKNTGFNFSEYLSEKRLEKAVELLLDTKLKVADISEMVGYGTPTYFLARFKAKYGVSPSAYRKAHILEQSE